MMNESVLDETAVIHTSVPSLLQDRDWQKTEPGPTAPFLLKVGMQRFQMFKGRKTKATLASTNVLRLFPRQRRVIANRETISPDSSSS